MRIAVVGGGPAGVYFSILAAKAWPKIEIDVFERNRADDTFGFGVVFSDETLEIFEKYDVESYQAIADNFAYWDDIEIHFKGSLHRIGGNGFCGCARTTLLKLLHDRARALGVKLHFETETDPSLASAEGLRFDRRRRRCEQPNPRHASRALRDGNRQPAQQVHVDGIDALIRCLHVFL
jgi:2-polyprenyl-6-methoxyphenol hydroxylase-like FAD-dependent oxidoreductase